MSDQEPSSEPATPIPASDLPDVPLEPLGEDPARAAAEGLPRMVPDFAEEQLHEDLDNIVPTRGYQMTPMVALGGSAGCIQALQGFFKTMPADSGMSFVVILHLSPTHFSTMPELLARATPMPVAHAEDGMKAEPNRVYVIPPGKHLATVNGHLRLTDIEAERGKRVAVDMFFRSLADTHGPHAAAIVLSGADGDGAIGLKRIRERGGLTIVQDPEEAEHPSMPRTSIETGMVDWILPVAQMPHRLLEYRKSELALRLPSEEGPQPAEFAPPTAGQDEASLRDVLIFLRNRTGRDFSYYKRATIVRRIARRMQVNGLDTVTAYLDLLRTHPGESGALLQDLLISVTNFFRDRDAFAALEEQIPALFDGKTPGDAVRVWVPACATGEEAYSIAILLLEHTRHLNLSPTLQVFGCDLDEEAIAEARGGLYTHSIAADVSEDRLKRFFVKDPRGYRVRREVREMVLFAAHDLLKDAPFSRVDLVSCRNLLIYLNRDAQQRALETFAFALRPGGRLFLGSSESVDENNQRFSVLDKKHRIYEVKAKLRPGILPMLVGTSNLGRLIQAQEVAFASAPVVHGLRFERDRPSVYTSLAHKLDRAALAEVHYRLLERLSPPSVIVNAEHEIVHLSEHMGRFLQISGGEPTTSLLRLVNPALRIELRSVLMRAAETNAPTESLNVPVGFDGHLGVVDLLASPAPEAGPGFLLVICKERPISADEPAALEVLPALTVLEPIVRQFERELELVKAQLRDTVEQYEASTEEMKASNEELQAMNEELRSASEELETSREELQSINEELTTVNLEMRSKVEELAHANSDLQNLMASTSIATIFLDRDLAVTRYTPTAADIFYLVPTDPGRPLAHVKLRLDYPELIPDAERVLRTLVPIEREVQGDEHWFLARLQPYRTVEDHIGGLVLTFVDVTERRRANEELREQMEELARFNAVAVGRETRMIELKQKVNEMASRLGETPPYKLDFSDGDDVPPPPFQKTESAWLKF